MGAGHLNDGTYKIIDELSRIAGQLGTTVARAALAWVQGAAGRFVPPSWARERWRSFDDNLAAIDVALTPGARGGPRRVDHPDARLPRSRFSGWPG